MPIRLATPAGIPSSGPPSAFAYHRLAATFLSPSTTLLAGGDTISIEGTSLDAATDVLVDGVSVWGDTTIVGAEHVTFIAPEGAAVGTVYVEIANAAEESAIVGLSYE